MLPSWCITRTVLASLSFSFFFFILLPPPRSTLFPYTTLFRSIEVHANLDRLHVPGTVLRCLECHLVDEGRCRERGRSEEHTSELQSLTNLVCRLLLEKKKKTTNTPGDLARARATPQYMRPSTT